MFHVVDPDPEGVMTDEEAAHNTCRLLEEHRHFRPEIAVLKVMGAVFQGVVKLVEVDQRQKMALVRLLLQPLQHLLGRHHQFQQGREGGFALQHEVQITADVLQAKAVVLLVITVTRQFVDAVAQPVVVGGPVLAGDEIVEGLFHHAQPACIPGQPVQSHQAEGSLAIVVDDAEVFLDRQVGKVQHMVQAAALGLLHEGNALGQAFQQRQMGFVAAHFAVLDQRQQRNRIASELDFIVLFYQESQFGAVRRMRTADELARQVAQCPLNGGAEAPVAGGFPRLDQRIGAAGVAQGVVGGNLAVEAGEITVHEFAASFHLPCQKAAAGIYQCEHILLGQSSGQPSPCLQPAGSQSVSRTRPLAVGGAGGEDHRVLARMVEVDLHTEAASGVDVEVLGVDACLRHIAARIQHRVGVQFLFQKSQGEVRGQGQPMAEIVALGGGQAAVQYLPWERFCRLHPVHP